MDRRNFLRTTALGGAGLALLPRAFAPADAATSIATGPLPRAGAPYGPLQAPDANGIRLPAGFASRIVAVSNQAVLGTSYLWHLSPDGGACFTVPDGSGDYVYVSNSETVALAGGGVSAIRFKANGQIRDAYRILAGTNANCAGGATPWGTWLSAEEWDRGQIWECDPFRASQGVPRPALGFFAHEAAAVDPVRKQLYLTEDREDGRFYRFTPLAYPDLSEGRLDVAAVNAKSRIQWKTVSDGPVGASAPRPPGTTAFDGSEGIWWHDGFVYFTTKGDNRVWRLDTRKYVQELVIIYDDDLVENAQLRGVDNLVVSAAGEVIVAEDGDDMQLQVIQPGRVVGPLLQIVGQDGSELAGPAFGPLGDRLYFSSQRALGGQPAAGIGITYEVRGPFRGRLRQ